MFYSDELIEEVREKNNIVDVISQYVSLKKRGSTHFGLCPFHNEKSPSFAVTASRQMYYCFGCGAGGNVFTFIMEYENFTFLEALQYLAQRASVTLPQMEYSKSAKEQLQKKNVLLDIHKEAANYYYLQQRQPANRYALTYFQERGLTDETIRKFGLGLAPRYSDALYQYLKHKGHTDEVLKDTGLFLYDERRGMADKFWNRVMFPIVDSNGRVIGFGGRVLGDGKPKYLNSPETSIFDKSRNLYGLNLARTTRQDYFILCEGYMDVIAMHQAGFTNAVATLGTALTAGQTGLLRRYVKEIMILYDSDEAGVKATLRAIPILKNAGISAKVVNIKPYKDPDEFIKNEGAEAFEKRLKEAKNAFLFQVAMLERNYTMSDPQDKTTFFEETAVLLMEFEQELERTNYIEALADIYKISASELRKMVNQKALAGNRTKKPAAPAEPQVRQTTKEAGHETAQKLMLTWMVSYPSLFDTITSYITEEDFVTPLYREVAKMLFEQKSQGDMNPARLLNRFVDSKEQREVAALFNASLHLEHKEEQKKAFCDTVVKMKEASLEYKSSTLDPTDIHALQRIVREKKELEELRSTIGHIDITFQKEN
ncbi:MAG: DNA primase [Lachnospiraceae bacterium]